MAADPLDELRAAHNPEQFLHAFTEVVKKHRRLKEANYSNDKSDAKLVQKYLGDIYQALSTDNIKPLFEAWLINIVALVRPSSNYQPNLDAKSIHDERVPKQEQIKDAALIQIAKSKLRDELVKLVQDIKIHESCDSKPSSSHETNDLFTQLTPKSSKSNQRTGIGTAETLLWKQQVLVWQEKVPEIIDETGIKTILKHRFNFYASLFRCYRLRAIKKLVNDILCKAMDEKYQLVSPTQKKELLEKIANDVIVAASFQGIDNHVWTHLNSLFNEVGEKDNNEGLLDKVSEHADFTELFQQLKEIIEISTVEKHLAEFVEPFILSNNFAVTLEIANSLSTSKQFLSSADTFACFNQYSSSTMKVVGNEKKKTWVEGFRRGVRNYTAKKSFTDTCNEIKAQHYPMIANKYKKVFPKQESLKVDDIYLKKVGDALNDYKKPLKELIKSTTTKSEKKSSQILADFRTNPTLITERIKELKSGKKEKLIKKLNPLVELINSIYACTKAIMASSSQDDKQGAKKQQSAVEQHIQVLSKADEEIFFTVGISTLAKLSPHIVDALNIWQKNCFFPLTTASGKPLREMHLHKQQQATTAPQAFFIHSIKESKASASNQSGAGHTPRHNKSKDSFIKQSCNK